MSSLAMQPTVSPLRIEHNGTVLESLGEMGVWSLVGSRKRGLEQSVLPARAGVTAMKGGVTIAMAAPHQWLIYGEREVAARIAQSIFASMESGRLLTELTHGRVGYRLNGTGVFNVLETLFPLDFGSKQMAPGRCAHSLLGQVTAYLEVRGCSEVLIMVDQSDAPYCRDILAQAMTHS